MISRGYTDPHIEVAQTLEGRRNRARRLAYGRYSEVAENCAGFEEIEGRIRTVGLKYNRMALAGELTKEEASEAIRREIGALSEEKRTLLDSAGYGRGYLDVNYSCGNCCDMGYIDEAGGRRERCPCYLQLLVDRLYQGSNIAASSNASFETFDPLLFSDGSDWGANNKKAGFDLSPRENIARIRDSSMRFIDAFKAGDLEDLYFFGPPGTGKSFVCTCIAKRMLDAGVTAIYISAPTLFNVITEHRMKAFREEGYTDAPYRGIVGADLLIVDDLGTESMTQARYAEFITLLNSRSHEAGKSTIIATNLDLKALRDAYDERIVSRIIGNYKIIPFYGADLRLQAATGNQHTRNT